MALLSDTRMHTFWPMEQRHTNASFLASHILISPGKCEMSDTLVFLLFSKRFFLESAMGGRGHRCGHFMSFQASATHFDWFCWTQDSSHCGVAVLSFLAILLHHAMSTFSHVDCMEVMRKALCGWETPIAAPWLSIYIIPSGNLT